MKFRACLLIFAVAGLAPLHAAGTQDRLTTRGIGDIRVGITRQELEERFDAKLEYTGDEAFPDGCAYWSVPTYPDLGFMIVDGKLARIDVDGGDYKTLSGAHVGMREQAVLDIYDDNIVIDTHPYVDPDGKYLVYKTNDKQYGMILETFQGAVTSYRIGTWNAVQFIEGCA